ncbi:hypothetical protein AB0M29_37020 [Streptomyces sp. NPDC051976]|uniref:hypothetical protein n=1 Tax=Streptomyces sp. NPDC051976 TaxID=3154947 RepID=UPI00343EABB2
MSRLEEVAGRILRPFIIGEPGQIEAQDMGAIAAWIQKTALTAMLVSSEDQRNAGYGLPSSEYRELRGLLRDEVQPLPASQFWIGRHEGVRGWSVRVTPLIVTAQGLPEPQQPQGYAMTVVLGQVILHGVRFTTPSLQVELTTRHHLPQLWPTTGPVTWPRGAPVVDAGFLGFAGGKDLQSTEHQIQVLPWKPATDLPQSRAVDGMVELPVACGQHMVYYPARLADEAVHGRFYAFGTACECSTAYMIHTEPDGAHCKAIGTAEGISNLYENLAGEEIMIRDQHGWFLCKRLTTSELFEEKRPS